VLAENIKVHSDVPCPSGYTLATPEDAANSDACNQLGEWDIVRLAGGGSLDGPGYGCNIRSRDSRALGNTLCRKLGAFEEVDGDDECPEGTQPASYVLTKAQSSLACEELGDWDIARLADGGSIDGPSYGCNVRAQDDRELGNTLCVEVSLREVQGDVPCPAGYRYLTPAEARRGGSPLCSTLGQWDIVRLEGGGSIDGPGYGCNIRDYDERQLGDSLCTNN
jgi:hypothetical protein